ncbi:MAG: DMT family transporter [Candidatus Rifleibacteriota bacterium]
MKQLAPYLVVLCGILRSTDLYFRNPMIKNLSIFTLITWEHLINLTVVFPIILWNLKQFLRFSLKDFFLFIMVGCGASAMGILCFTEAFLYINPALAVLLQKLQPIMTIAFGALLLREKVDRRFIFWALIAIVSSYFVSFGLTFPFAGEGMKIAKGAFFAIMAAFFWGGGTIWGKMLLARYDQLFVMSNRFLFGSLFTLILAHSFGQGLQMDLIFNKSQPLIYSISYMAVISGFLATTFFYCGLRWVNASLASILELFFPVSSVIIMWISFNRPITMPQLIAGIVMFFSVYKINTLKKINDLMEAKTETEVATKTVD